MEQQQAWCIQLFGLGSTIGWSAYNTYEALTGKEDQLELPLEYSDPTQTAPLS